MRFKMSMLILVTGVLSSSVGFAFNSPPFPRIGAMLFGSPTQYDQPALQARLGYASVALLSYWPGWESGHTETFEQAIEAIKQRNPNIQLSVYSQIDSVLNNPSMQPVWTKLNAMNWWLYPSGASGTPVASFYTGPGGPFYQINTTLYSARDSNGQTYMEWYAKWHVTNFVKPNPALNSFFIDNVFVQPSSQEAIGDWSLSGIANNPANSPTNPTLQHQLHLAYIDYFNSLRAQAPGSNLIGNIAQWGAASANLTDYKGQLNGGLIEGLIGYSWSPEAWGGWQEMMNEYRKAMSALAAPQLALFAMIGSPTDYQAFRYGLASCLMDNGYFVFDSSSSYNDFPWFDEYGANLGTAISSPPTTAWKNGVYRRDFTNGIALVNPKGNGQQTVTLEAAFTRIHGTQAPSVNSGQSGTTVTLQDRDGIILLRPSPVDVPAPPSNVTVH